MKAKVHPDGKRRITMNMSATVEVETLTLYALHMVKSEPSPVDIITGANKREIFALARANIEAYGKDTALAEIPTVLNPIEIKKAEEHVRSVFPEID